MQVSAEVRWFWPDRPAEGLEDWFRNRGGSQWCAAGGGGVREDRYLRAPGAQELGIKRRGGKKGIEIKGLVAVSQTGVSAAPFVGAIEIWTKWTSQELQVDLSLTVSVEKQRWLRKFDCEPASPSELEMGPDENPVDGRSLPARGCNVELTRVALPDAGVWWTLGFEAFGSIRTVEDDLRKVASLLAARQPPDLGSGLTLGYPAWLSSYALEAQAPHPVQ